MPVSLHKNLKVVATDDTFILKMENTYDFLKNYLTAKYSDLSHEITYADILIAASQTYEVEYINVPTGATFKWYINDVEITTSKINVLGGTTITYELTLADASKCVGEQVIDDDFIFNCEAMQPNRFLVTITSDKPLFTILVLTRHYGTPEATTEYNIRQFTNNSYTFYADKDEEIYIFNLCASGWSSAPESPESNGISELLSITNNTVYQGEFPYEAWNVMMLQVLDENGNSIGINDSEFSMSGPDGKYRYTLSPYLYITFIYAEKNTTVTYNINVEGYSPISESYTFNNSSQTKNVNLVPLCSYTLTPIPADATVTLAANGYTTVSGTGPQTITVTKGTTVMWLIEKEDYISRNGTASITSNPQEQTEEIVERRYKVNVEDYEYTLNDGTLTLTKYIGTGTELDTPEMENI